MKLYKSKYRIDSSRLANWDYSRSWWYYITICTKNFKCWFGEVKKDTIKLNNIGKLVEQEWLETKSIRINVDLDYYVIMPNHLHGILIIEDVETSRRDVLQKMEMGQRPVSTKLHPNSLGSIIGQFKSVCTKQIRNLGLAMFAWQPRFYDHIIRNEKDLQRIRTYIENNPLKWELDEYYKKEQAR